MAQSRIHSLDALRGFALLGILVVNIQMFSGWGVIGSEGRAMLAGSEYDPALQAWLRVLAHDKFYSLFSLLFGYSFVLLAMKAREHPVAIHLRRMVSLLVIGALHAVLLWPWDILFLYAAMGLLLTLFLHRRPAMLLGGAFTLLVFIGALRWQMLTGAWEWPWSDHTSDRLARSVPHFSGGDYLDVVRANIELKWGIVTNRIEELRPVRVLAMFLIGAAAARLRLADPQSPRARLLPRLALIVTVPALALAIGEHRIAADTPIDRIGFVACETLAGPMLAVAYATLLVWWFHRGGVIARLGQWLLAPAGRMALTNYLGQSVICIALFYGIGYGLFGEVSLLWALTVAGAVFAGQVAFSRTWLAIFRQGPLEWLWRWLIQGRRPALRT